MNTYRKRLGVYFFFLIILCCIWAGAASASEPTDKQKNPYHVDKAVIIEVLEDHSKPQEQHTLTHGYKLVKLKILSGERKGKIFETSAMLSVVPGHGVDAKPGVKVLVRFRGGKGDKARAYIVSYNREQYVYGIVAIFFILLLIIGKKTGLKSILSLNFTLLLIFLVLLPLLKNGYDPIFASITTAFAINIIVFLILTGFTRKSFTAILGTCFGVASAGLAAFIIGILSHTTGIPFEEARVLYFKQAGMPLDFRGLVFAGVLIGSLGAVMDVGMSIASALEELQAYNPKIPARQLFNSGMNVGKDIMGTMSNTLILAYVGGSVSYLLLLLKLGRPYELIISSNLIVGEIIQGIAGAIGIILAVPFTAFAAAYLSKSKKLKKKVENDFRGGA